MALKVGELFADLKVDMSSFKTSIKQAKRSFQGLSDEAKENLSEIKQAAQEAGQSLGTELRNGALAASGAIGGLVFGMQDTNKHLARLKTNAHVAGRDLGVVQEAFEKVAAVSGETDSAVETVSNLLASGFSDEQLSGAIDNINGAAIRFSDTLKTEGIADGIQETFATGKAIGQFAELIDRSGMNMDKFNKGLAEAKKQGEGAQYILDMLNSQGFSKMYETHKKLNPEVQKQAEASVRLEKAMADLAITFTPLVASITESITKFSIWLSKNEELKESLKKFGEIAINVGKTIVDNWSLIAPVLTTVVGAFAALKVVGSLSILFGNLKNSIDLVRKAFFVLNTVMRANPIGAILTVAMGLVILFQKAWKENWGNIQEITIHSGKVIWNAIKGVFSMIGAVFTNFVSSSLEKLGKLIEGAKLLVPGIGGPVEDAMDRAKKAVTSASDDMSKQMKKFEENAKSSFEATANNFDIVKDYIKDSMEGYDDSAMAELGSRNDYFRGKRDPDNELLQRAIHIREIKRRKWFESQHNYGGFGVDDDKGFGGGIGDGDGNGIGDGLDDFDTSPFQKAMKEFRYLVEMGKLSTKEQLDRLKQIKKNYAKTQDEIHQINVDIYNKKKELDEKKFKHSMSWIEQEKYYNRLNLKDELAAYKRVQDRHKAGTEKYKEMEREIYRVKRELEKKKLDLMKDTIEEGMSSYHDFLDDQEDRELDSIKNRRDAYRDMHDERMDNIDKETNKTIRGLEKQMDMLDKSLEKDRFTHSQSTKNSELSDLEEEYAIYKNAATKEGQDHATDLLEQINKLKYEIEREQKEREVSLEKDKIKEKIDAKKEEAKRQKELWEKEFKEKQKEFDQERTQTQEHYDQARELAKLYKEDMLKNAKSLAKSNVEIMTKGQNDILKMLDSKLTNMKEKGKNLGKSYANGILEAMPTVKAAIQQMTGIKAGSVPAVQAPSGGVMQNQTTNYNSPLVEVKNLEVRSDEDVKSVSRELFALQKNSQRGKGGRI